jgi:hypothetical protein
MFKEFMIFKKQAQSKEEEMRLLQTSMGEMNNDNERLKTENESESDKQSRDLLDCYYRDIFAKTSDTRGLIDLDASPPSEKAIEGTLVILKTMFSRPLEFSGDTKKIDLVYDRPETGFSNAVPTLQSLGFDKSNVEHVFFAKCYMQFQADPTFCTNGKMDSSFTVVSLPPGGSFPPRASLVKQMPRKLRNFFLSQKGSDQISNIGNKHLNLKPGGGLVNDDELPKSLHLLLGRMIHSKNYKNPSVPLSSQFFVYLQNGLTNLDELLLNTNHRSISHAL